MKLTGELKDKVEQAKDLEEAKAAIAEAGMLLSDDEVSEVAGGGKKVDSHAIYCTRCKLWFSSWGECFIHISSTHSDVDPHKINDSDRIPPFIYQVK